MPIPAIAILAVMALSAVWPAPKLDHEPPASGGVFNPHIVGPRWRELVKPAPAEAELARCHEDDCGKEPRP